MNRNKLVLRVVLLGFVAAAIGYMFLRDRGVSSAGGSAPQIAVATPAAPEGAGFVAYYFHGTRRCRTCRTIEAQAQEAISTRFADELRRGRLRWEAVNLEDAGNAHYAADYAVTGSTLVIAELKGGKAVRFGKLDKVWDLVYQKPAFVDYVAAEVTAFMKGKG